MSYHYQSDLDESHHGLIKSHRSHTTMSGYGLVGRYGPGQYQVETTYNYHRDDGEHHDYTETQSINGQTLSLTEYRKAGYRQSDDDEVLKLIDHFHEYGPEGDYYQQYRYQKRLSIQSWLVILILVIIVVLIIVWALCYRSWGRDSKQSSPNHEDGKSTR